MTMTFFSSMHAPLVSYSAKIFHRAVNFVPWLSIKQALSKHAEEMQAAAVIDGRGHADGLYQDGNRQHQKAGGPFPDGAALIKRLGVITKDMTRICKNSEPDFLHLGERLNHVYQEAKGLTQKVVAMLETDQKQKIQLTLKDIEQHATDAVLELNERRNLLMNDLHVLQIIRDDLSGLNAHNRNFRQVAKNLKMVGLNISIESARSAEAKTHFQALAEEIVQLAQTVGSVARNISDDTGNAQRNMDKIEKEISSKLDHLDDLIQSADKAVDQALRDVEDLLQMSITAMDDIRTKADDISRQVGKLVVSIQIHDNISQRVAHIDTAFEETIHLIRTSTMMELPATALRPIFGKVYGVTRLQIAQLHIIIEDVETVHKQCIDALERLETAVEAVSDPRHFSFSKHGGTAGADDNACREPIMILDEALGKLTVLFEQGSRDIELLHEARRQTGRTITQMNDHIDKVREINYDIHLKALNAVVKSMRLGTTGKSIEALVKEMKELAERSNATIETSVKVMGKITSASNGMDEKGRDRYSDEKTAEGQLRDCITNFHNGCGTFKQKSEVALEIGRNIQEKTTATRNSLDFFNRLLSVFKHHLAELEQMIVILQPFADDIQDDWKNEEKDILNRYTMKREREAHQRIYAEAACTDDIDNVLFDVAGEDVSSMTYTITDDAFDDNVELF